MTNSANYNKHKIVPFRNTAKQHKQFGLSERYSQTRSEATIIIRLVHSSLRDCLGSTYRHIAYMV